METSVKHMDLSMLPQLVNLSDPQISPDGSKVVLVHSMPNFAQNRYENKLILIDIATGNQQPLTYHRPEVAYPRWSPEGDRVAFLAKGENEKTQIFLLSLAGGEARCLTATKQGISSFVWRPDGKAVAFVTEDEPLAPEQQAPEADASGEQHNKSFAVGDHDYLATAAPQPAHIWLISLDDGATKRLTAGTEGVMRAATGGREPLAWAPDGTRLAYTSQPRPHSGEVGRGSLKLLEVEHERVQTLVPGPTHPTSPTFSPDGQYLAYARPQGASQAWHPHAIYVAPIGEGQENAGSSITDALDRTFYEARWLPDGQALLLCSVDHTRTSLWQQPLTGNARRLELGAIHPNEGSANVGGDGAIVFIGKEAQRPAELYYMASTDAQPRQLTDFNAAIAALTLGQVTSLTWQGPDGFTEDGVLIYPSDFTEGKQYPLVLMLHGGPMGATTEAFNLLAQLMAARGWIMFSPNYRGSSNLGRAYQTAVIQDAGDGPGRDVMAGLAAVKQLGIVDESRIAVSGWSYGGYMTTWLIGHYSGWAAAVAGAAVTDYADSYYLSDLNVIFGGGFHEPPWSEQGAQIWREQSPITYATKITTPTLILSNTGDLRVPITQSYKLYHILKAQGVAVQFIAYPLAGHFPGDPVHQRDVYRRWLDWIERHFD
ncbi:MAG: S9 family peptidase [Caldilineaceae bacterium]